MKTKKEKQLFIPRESEEGVKKAWLTSGYECLIADGCAIVTSRVIILETY